ncbi:hypothetical protein [Pyruvatibacter sp.]|uniref:DUF4870 family protein n=1 Tax=Pyruvatibacter sp. TaxID=1981328 RepID=UPI0032ED1B7D
MSETPSSAPEPAPQPTAPPAGTAPDPLMAHIVYGLYALGFFNGFTGIVGLIIAYVRRNDVRGTFLESHFTYQIRTFWISLGVGLISVVLMIVGIGFLLLLALAIWLVYRIVKGWLRLADGKPVADPEGWL